MASFTPALNLGNPQQLEMHITIPVGKSSVSFDQTVPFTAGKTVQINQTSTSNGYALTFERVVITETAARFYFKHKGAVTFADSLSIGGVTYTPTPTMTPDKNLYEEFTGDEETTGFWHNLLNDTGTWTLNLAPHTESGMATGTWQFTFVVS
jgi:hypothetical protein